MTRRGRRRLRLALALAPLLLAGCVVDVPLLPGDSGAATGHDAAASDGHAAGDGGALDASRDDGGADDADTVPTDDGGADDGDTVD